MAVQEMSIVLSAYRPDGQGNDAGEYVRLLGVSLAPYALAAQQSSEMAVNLDVGALAVAEYARFGAERWDHFEKAIAACLTRFASWLAAVPTENVERLRAAGWNAWVVVNLWMDQDQMDFRLPPALSGQLGRLGLELYVLSNE